MLLGLGAGATVVAVGLFQVGSKNQWTSDGPGMLGVMVALGVFGLLAVAALSAVFGGNED